MADDGVLKTARSSIAGFAEGVTSFASSAVETTTKAASSTVAALTGGEGEKKEEGFLVVDQAATKEAERKARIEAATDPDDPMAKVTAVAKEYYGRARTFTEENVSPVVGEKMTKVKDTSLSTYSQLAEEGLLKKDVMMEAKDDAVENIKVATPRSALSSVAGDMPFVNLIPNVETYVDLKPDLKASFLFWLLVCLAMGYTDVSLFALIKFFGDAGDLFTYLPMYLMKLAFDLAVATVVTYGLYFIFIKSGSSMAKMFGLGVIAFVALKSLLASLMTCGAPGAMLCFSGGYWGVLQFFEFLANAVLLMRAVRLYKAGEPYVPLNEEKGEEEAVIVPGK